tara:strand:- start:208 stop:588 length:381 start_codon:yes stop_codon:yes gene_type:complete
MDDGEILCRVRGQKPKIEIEADRFAAALLMPAANVSNAIVGKTRDIRTIGQARALANDLITKRGFSNVSNSAMVNRLKDLGILTKDIPYQGSKVRKTICRPSTLAYLRRCISKFRRIISNKVKPSV